MVLPRPTVLRAFAPSRLIRSAPRTANRAVARRGYASSHGAHPEPSSDLPWAMGALAVTLPTCWYLWPSGTHAESHHEHAKETKQERADALTHEGDEKSPIDEDEDGKEVETPEAKGDTDGVQFKGKTADGDEENRQGDTRKIEDDSKGAKKLRIDSASAVDLGVGPDKRDDGSESAATNKPISKTGGEGGISSKQMGLSTTATKHSTDIANDDSKSKKGEGTPETAKAMGTVSVNRPTPEQNNSGANKGEDQSHNPNPEAAKSPENAEEKSGETTKDEPKEDEEKEEKSE